MRYRRQILCFSHSSRICAGQILACTSPMWALSKRSMHSLDWPMPPPMVQGSSPFKSMRW